MRTLLRLLRLHDATLVERKATLWTAAFFFCVLCSYYLLRPLREEIGTSFGKENLLLLFSLTFVFITVLNPLYMLLANRLPTSRFLPRVMHGFAGSFVVLALVSSLVPPLQQGVFSWASPECLVAAFFYSWVTAFVVCGVALVWVHAVDFFTTQQGKRLFGLVSVGGTLGAIVASALAWVSAGLPRWLVMVVAAIAIESGVFCYARSLRACELMVGGAAAKSRERVASSGSLEGLRLLFRSKYLMGIAGFVMLAAIVATAFYYTLNDLAVTQIEVPGQRRALFSQINLFQNLCSLVLQIWVTRTALLRYGVAVVLCVMPAVSLFGISFAALAPAVGVFAVYEVLRRTMQFAFDKPAREVLYTPLGLEEKYKTKAFIDTAVLRFGDLAGAFLNDLLVRHRVRATIVAGIAAPLMVVWGALGMWLGRRCKQKELPSPDVLT
jgi:ATP:ADP antiporter, AAA family